MTIFIKITLSSSLCKNNCIFENQFEFVTLQNDKLEISSSIIKKFKPCNHEGLNPIIRKFKLSLQSRHLLIESHC